MFTNTNAIAARPAPVRRDSVGGPIPTAVVLDFARARKVGGTAQIRAALSDKNRNGLPLGDLVVIAGLFLATTFYPALMWLLLLSSGE
jgi:hypothetical protein